MPMRGFPSSLATYLTLIRSVCSINDVTVPYMTAYIDLDDPFLNHNTDGLTVYAVPYSAHILE